MGGLTKSMTNYIALDEELRKEVLDAFNFNKDKCGLGGGSKSLTDYSSN